MASSTTWPLLLVHSFINHIILIDFSIFHACTNLITWPPIKISLYSSAIPNESWIQNKTPTLNTSLIIKNPDQTKQSVKMVAGFNRSFSLSGIPHPKTRPVYHVRSISLPSDSHPLVAHLHHHIQSLYNWQSQQPIPVSVSVSTSVSWICDGLVRLDRLHSSLHHLLELPQHQLQHYKHATQVLVDDFLCLTDIYDTFRSDIVATNEHLSNAQIALRRHDQAVLLSSVGSVKKTCSKFAKAAGSLRFSAGESGVGEVDGVVREVIRVTAEATSAVLLGMAGVLSLSVVMGKSSSWMRLRRCRSPPREEGEEWSRGLMERLEEMEECVGAVESGSENLLRGLTSNMVSLLNRMSC